MNKYMEWKNKRQEEFNKLPIKYAFSDKQFKEGMEQLGLHETETDKVFSIGGGGFMKKEDKPLLDKFIEEDNFEELKQDKEFFIDMLVYELGNHEYSYTRDLEDTLEACDITQEQLENNERIREYFNEGLDKFKRLEKLDEYEEEE